MLPRKLKICGITDENFAKYAASRGVDFLGFIFAPASPRRISVEKAKQIRAAAANGRVKFVGVFTDIVPSEILSIARTIPLDVIQIHKKLDNFDFLRDFSGFNGEIWLLDPKTPDIPAGIDAILIDGTKGTMTGGTGQLADWTRIKELKRLGRRVVLAGGIGPHNFRDALQTAADIIDVNSTLETAPGVKSTSRLDALLLA